MKDKIIIFGPWVGEFSYELSWWNPECRQIRNEKYPNHHAVHLGFLGRKVAYKDFIDEYISHPLDLEKTLSYPATYGEHINGRDIIPQNFINYLNNIIESYKSQGYKEIVVHKPNDFIITRERTMSELPFGEFVSYKIDPNIESIVKSQISNYFNNNRPTLFLMARIRTRKGKTCYLDWNPNNWVVFTKMLIERLKVNIISLKIPTQGSRGGSIGLSNHPDLQDLKEYIMDYHIDKDKDSLEKQYAILKNTKCSIYGSSGAAVVPFFINSPTFTQQTKEEGFRLKFKWERNLTNNLEKVRVFDKYRNNEIYNSSPEELYEEFKLFYEELG
tara:strand:- start:5462 stop:6451 length:990 start_codon:yes stop_codon:yes gene_type:complete